MSTVILERSTRSAWVSGAGYSLMLAAAFGLFLLIRAAGNQLEAPLALPVPTGKSATPGEASVNVIVHILATLAVVIGVGQLLGRILLWVGQPPVIGQVLAGILLGPSVLGAISPTAMHALIPDPSADPRGQVTAAISAIAQLGVVLYMFLVGLELNAAKLKHEASSAIAISHAGIVVPFIFGAALALWLYPSVASRDVSFTSFALFLGAAMAVTAFPVLARILADRGLAKSELGVMALGCAAADDVTAWCLLAFVVGVAQAELGAAAWVIVGAVAFIAAMFFFVRPIAERIAARFDDGPLPAAAIPGLLGAVLVSALITEVIGIHAMFGAFLLGVVIPHDSRIAREVTARFTDVVTVLMLPAFFALTGMRTQIGLMNEWELWFFCGIIILVATAGKLGGTAVAARLTGYSWRTSAALGVLMNTRGLMGLIVLNVGLSLGVISPTLFAMLVIMALVTTLATAPLLDRLIREPS